mgnify:CR=1 FL=1
MRSKDDLLADLANLNASEMRTLNRYYLHPQGQRCCSQCLKVYSDYTSHFHIKKHTSSGVSYNTKCATCFSGINRARIAKYRKTPHVVIKSRVASFRCRAKKVGCAFNLDAEHLIDLWERQQGRCYYSNEVLDFALTTPSGKAPHMLQPSLDRKDPAKGYTKGNVVWCAYGINRMKNDFDYDTFIRACQAVLNTSKQHGK